MTKRVVFTDPLAQSIVVLAVSFNFLLALINQHVTGVTSSIVVAVQIVITAAALGLALRRSQSIPMRLLFPIAFLGVCMMVVALANGGMSLKSIYDVMLIPAFIMLGLASKMPSVRFLVMLLVGVGMVALWEALAPQSYISVVNPLSYLRNTREWIAESAAAQGADSGLYIGANRGGGSFFGLAGHRVGSIFLEPLSLGYFAVVLSFLFYATVKDRWMLRSFLTFCCAVLALAADTRLSFFIIVITWFVSHLTGRALRGATPFVIASIFAVAFTAYQFDFLSSLLGRDLSYRLAITFDELGRSLPGNFVGMISLARAGDSGVVTMISTVGMIGLPVLLLLCCGWFTPGWNRVAFLPIAVAIYFVTSSLFGGATLSIKSAALLGYLIGTVSRYRQTELVSEAQMGAKKVKALRGMAPYRV